VTPGGPASGSPAGPHFFEVRGKARFFVAGADARRYLNGQLTIDVGRLAPGAARQALILTPKGKLCAHLHVWTSENGFVLETEEALREAILERLERYIISDDVTIEEVSPPDRVFHVIGGPAPAGVLAICRAGLMGYDLGARPGELPEFSDEAFDRLRISTGTPLWGSELSADTLPQEARLENHAVDFDKGCYVGQEVVSRLKSVGHVNRRLYGFQGPIAPAPLPLTILTQEPSPRPAGTLTSCARDFELAQTLSLGYLNRQFEDFARFLAVDAAGTTVGEIEKRPI